ncbi:MAG: FAD-dependent monooxygenase [Catenulispora sp.]|nr:FAD-dependent monooxygenase [Catenulispora sp.]
MRVAIVGAGIGGLTLAQGLKRAGIDAAVYERDAALDSRGQGYRIHLHAGTALHSCLPPDLYELCVATAGRPSTQLSVMTNHLKPLRRTETTAVRDPLDPAALSTSVNRQTFREILAARLEDDRAIGFGHTCVGFSQTDDSVEVHFANGAATTADVLVAADGVGSAIRRRYLPQLRVEATGSLCIYGRTPITDETRPLIPADTWKGFTAIIGGHVGMATGVLDFREPPAEAARRIAPDVRLTPAQPYFMWALTASAERFAGPVENRDAAGLHATAQATIRRWHPDLRGLVAHATVPETTLVPIRSALPTPTPSWPSTRVTLLGDAVHAMSPARGSGANTALRDAALLTSELRAAAQGGKALTQAIADYERQMVDYGFEAVRASRDAERSAGGVRNPLVRLLLGIR